MIRIFYPGLLTLFIFKAAVAQDLKDCVSCSAKMIKTEQVKNLSIDELRFLTNDLFARKGYRFKQGEVDSYFAQKEWYKRVKDNAEIVFSDIEKQNIKLFQDRTLYLKGKREKLLAELQVLKQYVLADNQQGLSDRFAYSKTKNDFPFLKKVLEKVSIGDINWFKHKAKYEMTIDDGDFVRVYSIDINGSKVVFKYNNQGGSRLDEQNTMYPTDYNNEFAYWWIFEFDGALKYVKFDVAG